MDSSVMRSRDPLTPDGSATPGEVDNASIARSAADEVDVCPEAIQSIIGIGASILSPGEMDACVEASSALELLIEVTHDLRSPLGSMLVLIEHLRSGQSGPVTRQQEAQLGILYEAAFEAGNLTRNALEIARGHAWNTMGLPPAVPFSVAATWQSVRSLVAPIAQERSLTLRWAGPPVDQRVGHPEALQKVLLNLVTNALKYTARGVVSVTTQVEPADRVRFRVTDTGQGLSEPARRLIGDLPSPVALAATRTGNSLGLSICAQVLGAMGSALEVGRMTGPGTCLEFVLHLPPADPR